MAQFVENGLVIDGIFHSFELPPQELQELMYQLRMRSERIKLSYVSS